MLIPVQGLDKHYVHDMHQFLWTIWHRNKIVIFCHWNITKEETITRIMYSIDICHDFYGTTASRRKFYGDIHTMTLNGKFSLEIDFSNIYLNLMQVCLMVRNFTLFVNNLLALFTYNRRSLFFGIQLLALLDVIRIII